MGSTRLPGKVLKKVLGKPLLQYQIERIKKSKFVKKIIVATTNRAEDNKIVKLAKKLKVECYRGSNDDVLQRITDATIKFKGDINVEMISDSPLTDPRIMDKIINFFLKNMNKYDYVSNGIQISYPSGMEVCVYKSSKLIEINKLIKKNNKFREHVECHFTKNKKIKKCNILANKKYHYPQIFLEVDTKDDFLVISRIIKHFHKIKKYFFYLDDILKFLNKNDYLIDINNKTSRSWRKLKLKSLKGVKNKVLN